MCVEIIGMHIALVWKCCICVAKVCFMCCVIPVQSKAGSLSCEPTLYQESNRLYDSKAFRKRSTSLDPIGWKLAHCSVSEAI